MVTAIAIIPARGGSKRIPRKNVIPFRGRPMIEWTIDAALGSGLFDTVLVSTDDEGIAETAVSAGADVPFLRQAHADDHSPVSEAVLSALGQAVTHFGKDFDTVVQLMPNCPLRDTDDIRKAWDNFFAHGHDFQISAFEFGWMNPWWAGRLGSDGQPTWLFPEERMSRSQDLDRLYCPTGAIWMAKSAALVQSGSFYGPGHVLFPMSWQSAIDIDDLSDLEMAEAAAIIRSRSKGS